MGATSTPAPPQQLATPSGSQEASILDSSCSQGVPAAAVPLQAATTAATTASIADLSVMPEFAKIPESALSEVVSELMEAAGTPYYLLTLFTGFRRKSQLTREHCSSSSTSLLF